jgi:malate synthase
MEDAATAEISRVQIWQWRYHNVSTQDDGVAVSAARIHKIVQEEVQRNLSKGGRWRLAGELVRNHTSK